MSRRLIIEPKRHSEKLLNDATLRNKKAKKTPVLATEKKINQMNNRWANEKIE